MDIDEAQLAFSDAADDATSQDSAEEEEYDQESWISEYLSATGNDMFAEVTEEFIEDDFNLTGLGALVPQYHAALEMILDLEPEYPAKLPSVALIEHSAEILYGLIHARFITTRQGLNLMVQKYEYSDFGMCPRVLCKSTRLLPIGRYDLPGCETVRLCCPCCMDIYHPQSSRYMNVDGAFFGTTFAGLFLKTFPVIEQDCLERRKEQFQLTIYGFNVSEFSKSGPRMKWLRQVPENVRDLDEFSLLEITDEDDEQGGGGGGGGLNNSKANNDDDDDDDDENAMQIDPPPVPSNNTGSNINTRTSGGVGSRSTGGL